MNRITGTKAYREFVEQHRESKRKKNRKKHTQKRTSAVECQDCRFTTRVTQNQLHAAARLRCPKCGGPMNRPLDNRPNKLRRTGAAVT